MRTSYSCTNTLVSQKTLPFRPVTLEDREKVEQFTSRIHTYLCEHCFVDMYIWKDHYHTEICFTDDFLFVRCCSFPEKTPIYLAPVGHGDLHAAITLLQEDAEARGIPFILASITEEMLPHYQELFGDLFGYDSSEDAADYIYLSEKLRTLSGKKLQSKRNLINRFLAAHDGRWRYVPITSKLTDEAYAFHLKWCEENDGCANNGAFRGETCAIRIALDHWDALHLQGGLLYLDDKVIAFTLGCRMNEEMYVVQIEKADHNIAGAYQMINQQFVLANCADVQYVNREEDLGLEGLRKAKRSYYPAFYGTRYTATLAEGQR